MTRINDELLGCVIYLYPSPECASKGERVGGTGFILGIPTKNHPDMHWMYAVTNSHVIREGKSPVIRLNSVDGRTEVFPFTQDHWVHHPNGDDVAICLLSGLTKSRHDWIAVPDNMLISREHIIEHNIGPGEDVVMVGRFISHDGRQRNTPSVRFGNISMMPGEPVRNRQRGIDQESFLVETRSLSGYSGSPVFTIQPRPPRGTFLLKDEKRERMPDFLVGVDWGHLPVTEPVLDKHGAKLPDGWRVDSNSGQMAVVPAWKIRELLDSDPFVTQRDVGERALERLKKMGAIPDDTSTNIDIADGPPTG